VIGVIDYAVTLTLNCQMSEETPQTLAAIPRSRDLPTKALSQDMTVLASGTVKVVSDEGGLFHPMPLVPSDTLQLQVKFLQICFLEPIPVTLRALCVDHYHFEVRSSLHPPADSATDPT